MYQKHGFTLIELLVVVLIIGILAAVALPQYEKAVFKARAMEAFSLLGTFEEAQKVCYLEQGDYCHDVESLPVSFPAEQVSCSGPHDCVIRSKPKYYLDLHFIFNTNASIPGEYYKICSVKSSSPKAELGKRFCAEMGGVLWDEWQGRLRYELPKK